MKKVKGICSLRRGTENVIRHTEEVGIIELLYQQVHIPSDVNMAQKARSLVDMLVRMVPLWIMDCNKEPDAAMVAYDAMSGTQ